MEKTKALVAESVFPEVQPITPEEASTKRIDSIESEMIQAVNEMILINLDSSRKYASFTQKKLISHYFQILKIEETDELRKSLYERHQLDFEPIFRKAGWVVDYDKPGYNESYEPTFTFKKRKKREEEEY